MTHRRQLWPALVAVLLLLGCHDTAAAKKKKKKVPPSAPPAPKAEFRLSSPSFGNGGEFPSDNRGDEDNMNPALAWEGAPKNTQSFVLLVDSGADDGADAAKATHWVVYDIPKEVSELRDELSGSGASDGMTSFGSTYYQGPSADGSMCTFKLYALSTRLELPRGASREAVVAAMKGKILGRATLKAKV
ncbi:hypothetical protein EMIHUDRAFT_64220 [Emiliania huxleyi CCMP1516]|uniref:YbhB/YbcL family Raf kinase inhibitor-like protein n=2 Tax=Emiliania huxleyi TaxID=2903 RepID=A0A0D3JY96_EMIH1|nr:hypothetical protein EMIHUDRAFT_64220 [Emiliania huxleyi CCMP1516]EOD28481.1 hypothetical protein EMIHUDRAFT_64220 [Emiliania huxleyi CCMP1516]|eukprot:XP_005780910.1 hypothetical protein EMIHUDRAFT_64220 [Emiliania huxleyi CCMP1516]